MRAIDLTGRRFGRLVVESFAGCRLIGPSQTSNRQWLCRCDCGNVAVLLACNLGGKGTLSCGCLQKEMASQHNSTHGMVRSPEFNVWVRMRQRCTNPKSKDYPNYGGRGITVCERWMESFENFFTDMGLRPSSAYTLDRIDNSGNYGPGNCRWATRREQNLNTRQNRFLTYKGRTLTTSEWADVIGLPRKILHKRVHRGWSVERILTTPVKGYDATHLL